MGVASRRRDPAVPGGGDRQRGSGKRRTGLDWGAQSSSTGAAYGAFIPHSRVSVLALLRTRRWVAFTTLVLLSVVVFGLLSHWQWQRAEQRDRERVELLTRTAQTAVPLASALANTPKEWQRLDLTGTYAQEQFAVRRRPLEGRNGFWVLSRLNTELGPVWVNRGWVPAEADALAMPSLPTPPSGVVRVSGYYRSPESRDIEQWQGLPMGMVPAVVPDALSQLSTDAAQSTGAVLTGYLQLTSSEPLQEGLVELPLPSIDSSRNISYAVQWVLFAFVAVGGWGYMLRRESLSTGARDEGAQLPERIH